MTGNVSQSGTMKVRITAADGGESEWFEVTGEYQPVYYAHRTDAPPTKGKS